MRWMNSKWSQSLKIVLAHANANHEVHTSKAALHNQADNTSHVHVTVSFLSALPTAQAVGKRGGPG